MASNEGPVEVAVNSGTINDYALDVTPETVEAVMDNSKMDDASETVEVVMDNSAKGDTQSLSNELDSLAASAREDKPALKVDFELYGVAVTVRATKKKNYNKNTPCKICGKSMRDDTLKRHMKTHNDLDMMNADEKRVELMKRKRDYECREEQRQIIKKIAIDENIPAECYEQSLPIPSRPIGVSLEDELLQYNEQYLQKFERGQQIYNIISKGTVREESMPKKHRQALDLYRKSRSLINLSETELRPWQRDLLERIQIPTEREVIWIVGNKGNEGKTWFQSYLESRFGYERVVRLDLKARQKDLMHALSKRPLCAADIFLFNEPRTCLENDLSSYAALESIKDGCATSIKYCSMSMRFKTPNVVVVFSNRLPIAEEMSADRWMVYLIGTDGLRACPVDKTKKGFVKPKNNSIEKIALFNHGFI